MAYAHHDLFHYDDRDRFISRLDISGTVGRRIIKPAGNVYQFQHR